MIQLAMVIWSAALCGVALFAPGWLLPAVILCAPFEAAALVNAGGIGVGPYWLAVVLVVARCALIRNTRETVLGRNHSVRRAMLWMGALAIIGLAGAAVLPRVFAGTPVLSPRLDADVTAPLTFSPSNIAQAGYLALHAALLWYVVQTGGDLRLTRRVAWAARFSGAMVVAIAVYQFVAAETGLPFPDDFLYSNQAYVMQAGTAIADLPRLCSTFTEPAGMSVFLVGYLVFLIAEPPSRSRSALTLRGALVIATVAVLALSTSSTAYVGLAAVAAWACFQFIVWPAIRGRPDPRAVVTLIVAILLAVAAYAASDPLRQVVRKMVFEKGESGSYEDRSAADALATRLIGTTWGLGVGLGSNRASSFGPSLLSTVGICGGAALAGLLVTLVRPPVGDVEPEARQWHAPFAGWLVAIVATKLISGPDLTTPAMWAMMAALLSVHAAAEDPVPQWVHAVDEPRGDRSARLRFAEVSRT